MEVERLPTGSPPIDQMLNGGLEKGIITNVFGESGSGKTQLCVQAAAETAKDGGNVIYIDTEKGFSPERFKQIASEEELERLSFKEPIDFSQQKEAIESLEAKAEEIQPELIVVDSLVSLYRLKAKGDQVQEVNQELSRQLSQLSKVARKHDIPVLVTNQVYTSFDENELELVGRDVPRYWSKCLLKLSKQDEGIRKAEIEKHRSMPEGKNTRFKIVKEGLAQSDKTGFF
ncbi:MAG: DNA repair and recombination protein RadB [Candidatus Nanohaloarchaea archaeon]